MIGQPKFFDGQQYFCKQLKPIYGKTIQILRIGKIKNYQTEKFVQKEKLIKQNDLHRKQGEILQSILARVQKIKERQILINSKQIKNQIDIDQTNNSKKSTIFQSNLSSYSKILSQPINDKKNSHTQSEKVVDMVQKTSNNIIKKSKMLSLLSLKPEQLQPLLAYYNVTNSKMSTLNMRITNRSSLSKIKKDTKKINQFEQKNVDIKNLSLVVRKKKNSQQKRISKQSISDIQKNEYYDFITIINWSNNIFHKHESNFNIYKAFIDKGNNSILVKSILKKRFWWTLVESNDQPNINFYWTQNRNLKFILNLPKYDQLQICQQKPINRSNDIVEKYIHNSELKKILSKIELASLFNKQYKKENENWFHHHPRYLRMHNHLQFNWNLCNKKMLFRNLKYYYEKNKENAFNYIPITFHVKQEGDQGWQQFIKYFNEKKQNIQKNGRSKYQKNIWIIKPGENTNRGFGIQISQTIEDIKKIIEKNKKTNVRTYIIQQYLIPFLYNKRKFDIRCYMLTTSINKKLKAYWYQQGYIRTSSKQFNFKNLQNKFIHLTNDAIQNKSDDYGRFQSGNKISYNQFQRYLDLNTNKNFNFYQEIIPNMKKLAADSIKSTFQSLDFNNREYTFQIFGLDFLIDQKFRVWLIQINTNPCLELSCPLLSQIIPEMIDNSLRLCLDPIFPPPKQIPKGKCIAKNIFQQNKYSLIFNSEEEQLLVKYQNSNQKDI